MRVIEAGDERVAMIRHQIMAGLDLAGDGAGLSGDQRRGLVRSARQTFGQARIGQGQPRLKIIANAAKRQLDLLLLFVQAGYQRIAIRRH